MGKTATFKYLDGTCDTEYMYRGRGKQLKSKGKAKKVIKDRRAVEAYDGEITSAGLLSSKSLENYRTRKQFQKAFGSLV